MPEGYVLGVDIGGTSIKLAIVSSAGEIASSLRYPTSYGRLEDLLDSIYENHERQAEIPAAAEKHTPAVTA